jgi:hypothetical protein
MSTSGLTQQFLPSTLDGLVIINADEISIGGNPIDIATLVPYINADKPIDVGIQPIRTLYAPIADADVVNLLTLQNAVAYIEGINVANFVKYTGSNDNVDLSTYTISSSTAPSTGNNLTNKTYVDTQDNAVANFASATYVGYTNSFQDVDLTLVGNNSLKGYNLTATNKVIAPTAQFTGITSAAPALALGVDGSGNLNTFAVPSGASFPFTGTTNINGGLQTLQNATQFNPSLDANSYFVTGVFPTTYVFSTNWITNPVSGTTANIQLDPAVFYFDTAHKYVISFTGIYGTGATWVGTVFNNSTSLTVSDASIAITTTPQNLTMTFTAGSSNPTIYLRFVGASGTLRWTNFTIKEVDVQIMGNVALSSEIDSNIVQSNGRTANLANGLRVNQTSLATATTLTTNSLPTGVSASTLSGAYSLTATAGGSNFGMWLGTSFNYTAGAKYTYTFTGFSTNATATQAMILYTNTYTGGVGTSIGDYIVNVPITSSTVSGTFTATSNNNVVWNFVSSAAGRSISFSGFTLTRADVQIGGISNNVVPFVSSTGLTNSLMTVGSISLGYNGGSFTASTGIGSITFSSPTYTANSASSFQGIITLPALPNYALNTACIATFIGLTFPVFAVSPYPYFTLTCGSTVVFTSAVGASGTITMPFIPTSTTLFITIYFKAPPAPFTGGVLTWTNFTISTPTMTTTGTDIVNGISNIHAGTPFAVPNRYMSSGSLTIGDPAQNYGGGTTTWNTSTAGLLMECLDRTEIAVHDAGTRVASLMYYDGATGNITMGRNMGWGVSNIATAGNLFVPAIGVIEKTGGNSGANYCRIIGNDAGSSPYMEYYFNNQRRMYVGNASATEALIVAENGALLNFLTQGASRMTIDTAGAVNVVNTFRKNNNINPTTTYIAMLDGNSVNTPYIEFVLGGLRKAYMGYASATAMDIFSANNAILQLGTENVSRMTIQTNGRATHSAGDNSYMTYGPNSTWGANLVIGASTDRGGVGTAQIITTDGNLHLDAGNSKVMYYGYYALVRGFQNRHEFWGPMLAVNGIETAGINNSGGAITSTNQPFCIVGGVGGASIAYAAGTRFGSGGNLFAYTSAGMFNSGTNGWNSSLGVFYFPRAGKWQVNWSFYWNNFSAGSRATVEHFNSGGTLLETRYCALNGGGIGADTTQAYSSLFFGSAGSYLVASFQSGSGTLYFGGITHTHVTFYFNS